MSSEIRPGGPGRFCTLDNGIGVDDEGSCSQDVLDVFSGLLNVALNIHGETGGFGDGKTEVKSNAAGNAAKTDKDTPDVIDVVEGLNVVVQYGVLEGSDENQANQSSSFEILGLGEGFQDATRYVLKLPQPCAANTAVIIRPRILVEANSEEMTALRG